MKSQKIISLNPSKNYEIIGSVDSSTHDEIVGKIAAARAAQPVWAQIGLTERIRFLEKLYQIFIARKNEIGELISQEMGMPVSLRNAIDLDMGLHYMRGYLDGAAEWLGTETTFENDIEIHRLSFEPRGVVGVSVPWNYPFCNFIWGVMQNLVVGNTVVVKHSEECPLVGKLLEDIIASVGLPDGAFNELYGDGSSVGESLMNGAIDLIWFTGSTKVGKHLYKSAAKRFIPTILELGGSAPGIVFGDIDLNEVIESLYFNRFVNSGQTCDGLKRLIVHRSRFNEVVQGLRKLLLTKKIGDAQDLITDIGPLVAERQLVALEDQVADAIRKGAQIICGGKRPAHLKGAYYEPTLITQITFDMRIWTEEVFGPVLPIVVFDSEDEAIALANDTRYGLGAYIYTKNKEIALRLSTALKTGNVNINGANYNVPQSPFGGFKDSGFGREHGRAGLRELCIMKVVALKK